MELLTMISLVLVGADFDICNATQTQLYPVVKYNNNQYYVFWEDNRSLPLIALYGARVSTTGTVIDPNGKELFSDSVTTPRIACDGSGFLAVWRENC